MSIWGVVLPLSFGGLLTAHLAIALGLMKRRPRWRGWLVLVPLLAPAAPYFALKERMYIRSGIWGGSLLLYALALAGAYM